MPRLTIVERDGRSQAVDGKIGLSVMEVIRDHGIDDLLALCGGCCSCATCHVFVEPSYLDKLPPMGDDENDLLDSSEHRRDNSRLSCQIPLSEVLDGMKITIGPED